ncbi:ABC transporter substrate-binding protein [Paracoccus methylarcula]|uniref:ABC transporter substrate-binding protein n=1 Tax=Paracoccus methylarcula TaxID=72022 RepID=UPI001FE80DF9|nr:ABC transporter substrate-binding protein [Paracoccus methylarcula]
MNLKLRSYLAAAMVTVLACAPAMAQDAPKQGGTLVVSLPGGTPRSLNPAVQSGVATGFPGTQLFAAPLRYDEDWTPQPYLAKSWEISEDGLKVTLHLQENATFHDGEPITSEDVAFSVEVIKEHHPFKSMFEPVTSVDTPDEHTAVLNLAHPHPALMLAMSGQLMAIIPKHIYGDGQDPKSHPRNNQDVVGSGPFKLVEFKPGEHVVLERYEGYWEEGLPYLDRIVARIINDSSARAIALQNGEIQMATFENEPTILSRLQDAEGLNLTTDGYGGVGPIDWLAMNTTRGPLKDVKVRQAIAYAIDKNFILNALLRGTATEARTGIHPDSPLYNPDVNAYELDLDKANALLDEAGYPLEGGKRFELNIELPGFPGYKAQTEYVKAALAKVGIAVNVRSHPDFPSWAEKVGSMEFDLSFDSVYNWGDPVIGVNRTYLSSNIDKGIWSNTQGYSNERVDELLNTAATESDPEKRKALYKEFQEIVAEEVPIYVTNAVPMHTIYADKVGNPPMGIWASSSPYDKVYLKD